MVTNDAVCRLALATKGWLKSETLQGDMALKKVYTKNRLQLVGFSSSISKRQVSAQSLFGHIYHVDLFTFKPG